MSGLNPKRGLALVDERLDVLEASRFIPVGPVPFSFDSPGFGTTGFVVGEVLAGDIVCGWGVNITEVFEGVADAELRMNDSSGLVVVNGGNNGLTEVNEADATAVTLRQVFDGWTLALVDQPLVLCALNPDVLTAGQGDLYITILRPAAQ